MSYFSSSRIATGYARHRPYFHPLVIEKVREHLHLESKVPRALDVGCGAGLSTIALFPLAEEVVGIDASEEMVKAATPKEHVQYHHCPAEQLYFSTAYFQIITVCGALSWIDRDQFFPAARRVLCSAGWIVVYDNVFMGAMRGQSGFATWYADQFLSRYPRPPRDERPLTVEECSGFGFQFVHSATYTNEVAYSLDQFIDYLLTLTNLSVPLGQGRETEASAREWLRGGLATFFGGGSQRLEFGGYIWYLQRA
jgi:SAM-dependent methyltransferase